MIRAALITILVIAAFAMAGTFNVTFQDVTEQAGLKTLIISGEKTKSYVLEVNGSGACWFDYNNDGYMDLYLVNGSTLKELQGNKPVQPHRNSLFRNNKNGTFTDVTEAARVPGSGWGFGCVAADYDNDGHSDLFVTNFGPNILYHNNGDGTFSNVTNRAGLGGGDIWHAGAAFGDYDGDGFVDLYVSGYLDFDIHNPELKTCEYRGVTVHACGPMGYRGAPDTLYRNKGDGTFTDVTQKAGVVDNADGKEMSSMGVAVGDYDNDGLMDLFVTTFANDNYVLFHNEGKGFFADHSYQSRVAEATIPHLGWATFFLDYDNDGRKDLFAGNGHVYPEVDGKIAETYRQPLQLFRNIGGGKFSEASRDVGFTSMPWRSARGGAFCDYDNDGDIDILVSNIDDRPQLLRNIGGNRQHWIELKLTGTKSNADAIGAQVKIEAGGHAQYDHVRAGGSYISSNDPRLHFGLGERTSVDQIEIRWPSERTERLTGIASDQIVVIKEGSGIVKLAGTSAKH